MQGGNNMCTAISYTYKKHYFGRSLDLNYPVVPSFVFVPRNYEIKFKSLNSLKKHKAIYGIGLAKFNYPFMFDCANEDGLCFAGLNFPSNAVFNKVKDDKINLAPYELCLYLLGKYSSIKEVKEALKDISISDIPFNEYLPLSTLHYIMSDKEECIVIEQTKEGLKVYDNQYGVLTNNPPFYYHALNVNNYMNLTPKEPTNTFAKELKLVNYGKAMGAIGLPGDSSPSSRFVKATFLLHNVNKYEEDYKNVNEAFHVLNNVSTLKGESVMDDGSQEYTIYTSVYSASNNELYVRTYVDQELTMFNLAKEDLNSEYINTYDISFTQKVSEIN